jgi:aspartate-semialdehyde dehydrogenase
MMGSNMHFRDKIPVGILDAKSCLGQQFAQSLIKHPWFVLCELSDLDIKPCESNLKCKIIFSGLDSSFAETIETQFAEAGNIVISTCRSHLRNPTIPAFIPNVNNAHLALLDFQNFQRGKIVFAPSEAVVKLCLALKPLKDRFGLESLYTSFPQALFDSENFKEVLKILGDFNKDKVQPASFNIEEPNHFNVNLEPNKVFVKFKNQTSKLEIIDTWKLFCSNLKNFQLPRSPETLIHYFEEAESERSNLKNLTAKGIGVNITNLEKNCSLLDYKFHLFLNEDYQGMANYSVYTAEVLVKLGYVFW